MLNVSAEHCLKGKKQSVFVVSRSSFQLFFFLPEGAVLAATVLWLAIQRRTAFPFEAPDQPINSKRRFTAHESVPATKRQPIADIIGYIMKVRCASRRSLRRECPLSPRPVRSSAAVSSSRWRRSFFASDDFFSNGRTDDAPSSPFLGGCLIFHQVLYSIKARTVMMVSSSRGAGLSPAQAAAEDAAMGGDGGSMSSAALERVVATATATYNEW